MDGSCLNCLPNYSSRIPCSWPHLSSMIREVFRDVRYKLQSVNVPALDNESNSLKCPTFLTSLSCSAVFNFDSNIGIHVITDSRKLTMKVTYFWTLVSGRCHCCGGNSFLHYQGFWLILGKHPGNLCDEDSLGIRFFTKLQGTSEI